MDAEKQEAVKAKRSEAAARERRLRLGVGGALAVLALVAVVAIAIWQGAPFVGGSAGGDGSGAGTNAAGSGNGSGSSAAATTKSVTDSEGRSVTLPASPESIAVFDSFAGEYVVMIGAGPRMSGVPGGVVSDTILQTIYPELATKPVALSGNTVNIETLMGLSCDVALVRSTLADAERAKLDSMGIPYVVVSYTDVRSQINAMRLVGNVCGGEAEARSEQLAAYYEQTLALVEARAAQVPQAERLKVYHSINDALLTDATGSLGSDWITRAGCIDVSAEEQATSGSDYQATLEQVYVWAPDAVVCNTAAAAATISGGAQWAGLGAVEAGEVHVIPTAATRWGQRGDVETCLAMLWLGTTLYPSYYDDIDFRQTVVSYYKEYLGVDIDDALWEKIVSGEGVRTAGTGDGSGSGSGTGSGTGSGSGSGTGGGSGNGSGSR